MGPSTSTIWTAAVLDLDCSFRSASFRSWAQKKKSRLKPQSELVQSSRFSFLKTCGWTLGLPDWPSPRTQCLYRTTHQCEPILVVAFPTRLQPRRSSSFLQPRGTNLPASRPAWFHLFDSKINRYIARSPSTLSVIQPPSSTLAIVRECMKFSDPMPQVASSALIKED